MSKYIYQKGDCYPLMKTANEQRANKDQWREQAELKRWVTIRNEIMKAIDTLWERDGSYVNIWEEHWFPGIENFLEDLQTMGYHVYVGSPERPNNQGRTLKRYCVYLDELPNRKE